MFEHFKRVQSVFHRRSTTSAASTSLLLLSLLALAWLFCVPVPSLMAQTPTPVIVPTWRYDLTHSGQNTNETALTPSNVTESTFGKLFSQTVDGGLYAQPLYVPGLKMSDGLVHNVLFVATLHDSIYAFDADSNGGANASPIWHVTLLDSAHGAGSGATTVPYEDEGSQDIEPEIGITGTPTINPATNTLYVVAATKESGNYFLRLHAINIITGAEQAHSPVVITATVNGTGLGSSGGKLTFSPLWENQRGALDYYNGYVYFGFAAHGDNGPWHGWLFAYNATTLAQSAVVCTSPNGYGAGIWESGAGLPIDDDAPGGRMFVATANGTYTATPPFSASSELGDSIINFSLANGGLTPTDSFTSFNQAKLSQSDLDQGSGGILMVPDQQGSHPHVLVQVGKEGRILVLNRDNLGGYLPSATSDTNALQDVLNETEGLWSTPAYWNGNVYMWGNGDVGKLFPLNTGVMNTTPSSKSTVSSAFPGASFSISSNGAQDGIAWALRTDQYTDHGPSILYAFDANDLSRVLWESDTNSTQNGTQHAMKFAVPVVTNGKVYVVTNGAVYVYGLLNGKSTAAAPVISPDGGTFTASQSVKLSSTTTSADIYYTLDGSVPTPASTLYTGPITISTDTTLNAIASAPDYVQSAVSSAVFTFQNQTPAPTFTPGAGTYTATQKVTISDTDSNASIYYTTNGSTPGTSSNLYSGPITVSASETINAIAIDPSLQNSSVVSAAYVIQAGGSSINFGSGFSSVTGLTLNGSAINTDDSRLQLTNGADNEAGSMFWSTAIGIQAFTTDFSFQLSDAVADGFTFTIQNVGPKALGPSGDGLGYYGIKHSVAIKFDLYNNVGEGTDSTGVYSNGALCTVPAVDMTSSGVLLRSGDSMLAHVTYDGTTLTMNLLDLVTQKSFTLTSVINIPQIVGANTAYVGFTGATGGLAASQKILYWTYSTQAATPVTTAPTFSPAAGAYSTPQNIQLSSTTTGAVIYYTTNGTAPTTQSAVYQSAIPVGTGTTTIEAFAVASGSSPSAVVTATYVVGQTATAAPTFSPAAGTYTTTQNVTLSDTTANAVIYYTTNGTTPTTSSAVYSKPVSVAATETLKAIAVAPSDTTSSTAVATYTIQAAPTINFASGFSSNAGLSLLDAASVTKNVLQLTSAGGTNTKGAAWSTKAVNISSFTSDFQFQLLSAKGDGFTFTIQDEGVSAIGPVGSGLGYGASAPGGTGGIGRSVAVKFDIYNNQGEGTDSTGFYTDGASPTTPATSMTGSGVTLSNGDIFHAHLTYDGTTLTLVLTDTKTSASFTKSQAINIPSIVGAQTAYVGFTGGTGGLSMTTQIINWTLTSQ
jgi:hypothetical protein